MIPVGDDQVPGGPPALVNYALIALNILAFFLELSQPQGALESFITAWGVVPREYSVHHDLPPTIPLPFWTTLFTSMFLHGGWAHLGGNMLYLWIFGDNIEKVLGGVRYLIFYLVCGLAAAVAHILAQPASPLPTVGASGAISGILGAYLVLYPRVRVRMLFFFIIFFKVIPIPAWMVLVWWFFWQLVATLPELTNGADLSGGVAVWAHVGGFLTGILLVKLFENRRLVIRRSVPRVSG